MKRKIMNSIFNLAILLFIMTICSCRKFIEVESPYTSFNGENVYTTDATAISAVTAMFLKIGTGDGISNIGFAAGLSADELTLFPGNSTTIIAYFQNELSVATAPQYWPTLYQEIYLANAAIEGLSKSNTLTPEVKQQLLGESKFIRAFCYFYLVNIYGDVPLVVNTNYKENSLMSRIATNQVWQQITTDLLEAKDLLNPNYVGADVVTINTSTERVRPNKWTAAALLSRVYLYTGDWQKAEAECTEIIKITSLYDTVSLNNAFLKNPMVNKEAIWQIQPTISGWNTSEARVYILPTTGPNTALNPVSLNKEVVYSFEASDARRTNWIRGIKVGSDSFYYAYKYKSATLNAPITENLTVFRLAEQYLIRAEARIQQDNILEAKNDLNIIRKRAGLGNTTANDKPSLLTAILNERRVELFCEWGHRWFDLKRTNKIDQVMSMETPLKGGAWQSTDKLYPISISELAANPNLVQTPGYQ
jgi:hypothetical protein